MATIIIAWFTAIGVIGALIYNGFHYRHLRKQKNIDLFTKMYIEISHLQGEYFLYELKFHGKSIKENEHLSNILSLRAKMIGIAESFCYLINNRMFYDEKMVDKFIKNNVDEWYGWVQELIKGGRESGQKIKKTEWIEIKTLYNELKLKNRKPKRSFWKLF